MTTPSVELATNEAVRGRPALGAIEDISEVPEVRPPALAPGLPGAPERPMDAPSGAATEGRTLGILRPYNPISWFHPVGIHRVLARLMPRLPDVSGCLFLTFTINPLLFADPSAAFEHSRQQLRRVFHRLRKGAEWEGKYFRIEAAYCVKVEFHGNEWAHFHAVFCTRRFLPGALLNELWGLGRTNVRRITNERFRYLLKYVTKGGGELPTWVQNRKRLRVFQASRGFYVAGGEAKKFAGIEHRQTKRKPSDTLGERVERYRRTALFKSGTLFSQVKLSARFDELHATQIYPAAMAGRYLGGGHYNINDIEELEIWTSQTNLQK